MRRGPNAPKNYIFHFYSFLTFPQWPLDETSKATYSQPIILPQVYARTLTQSPCAILLEKGPPHPNVLPKV